MRTGGAVIAVALLASAATAIAAPKRRTADVELSPAGVLEANKPLTIGVRGERGRVTVAARVLPDDAIARLYRDVANRRRRVPRLVPLGAVGAAAPATVARLDHASDDGFAAAVDLRPLLAGKRGMVLVEARAGARSVRALFQVTDLGVLVVRSPIRSIVQVLRLSTGAPVAGATIMVLEPNGRFATRGTTDANGMLVLTATPADESLPPDALLLARTADGSDQVVLRRLERGPLPDADENGGADELPPQTLDLLRGETLEAHLITDRGAFQRGETVHVAGWIAAGSAIHPDGLRLLPPGSELRLTLASTTRTLATTSVVVTHEGHLSGTLQIPADAPSGNAEVRLVLPRAGGRSRTLDVHSVRIEAIQAGTRGIVVRSDRHELKRFEKATITVVPSPGWGPIDSLSWEMNCEPIWRFRPAGLPTGWATGNPAEQPTRAVGSLVPERTDGPVRFTVSTGEAPAGLTSWCRVRVRTHDDNGPARLASVVLLVHPRPYHVALKIAHLRPDSDLAQVSIRAVSLTGAPVAPHGVTLELDEDSTGALMPGSRCDVDLSSGRATLDIELPRARRSTQDTYALVARDATGQMLARQEVAGWVPPNPPTVSARPGDVVPFAIAGREQPRAGGLVAILGGGVQRALPLPAASGPGTVKLSAGEAFYPRVTLDVAAMHARRDDPATLEWSGGEIVVPESSRGLAITVLTIPEFNELRPARTNQSLVLRAIVRRDDGRIAPGARVSIAVVDEAIFSRMGNVFLDSEIT
ncbi:MAG TPA: hypothetical protein VN903_31910, partial [Polyangia bacterium]|nr:hypothetical protein [Polyangia bacterium]